MVHIRKHLDIQNAKQLENWKQLGRSLSKTYGSVSFFVQSHVTCRLANHLDLRNWKESTKPAHTHIPIQGGRRRRSVLHASWNVALHTQLTVMHASNRIEKKEQQDGSKMNKIGLKKKTPPKRLLNIFQRNFLHFTNLWNVHSSTKEWQIQFSFRAYRVSPKEKSIHHTVGAYGRPNTRTNSNSLSTSPVRCSRSRLFGSRSRPIFTSKS